MSQAALHFGDFGGGYYVLNMLIKRAGDNQYNNGNNADKCKPPNMPDHPKAECKSKTCNKKSDQSIFRHFDILVCRFGCRMSLCGGLFLHPKSIAAFDAGYH